MFRYKYRGIIAVSAFLVFVVAFYWSASFFIFLYSPASHDKQELILEIPDGASFRAATKLLNENNLLKDEKKFIILGKLRRAGTKIHAGELLFKKDMTPLQLLDTLMYGKPVLYTFVVPEGYNMYQIADILESKKIIKRAKDFVKAAKDRTLLIELGIRGDSAEGYLFPDTYSVQRVKDTKDLARVMNKRFKEVFTKEMVDRAYNFRMSGHELITMASIIEKETGAPEERKLISSVFYNRIKKGMPLQSDPTTIYGMWEKYKGALNKDDLKQYTPYNTYKIHGLPPGPICNPGKDAIMAALYPENTNYLYFVSKNDGTHIFSESYKDHQNAVNRFQKRAEERDGKSWRDLKKKS
ncbi:MAG: endolytic transglycosylase MltG [Pseudomonadota bacterium]